MQDPAAIGRRLALRVSLYQGVITLLVALVCSLNGLPSALAALAGGIVMLLGSLVAAWGAFGGGVAGAGVMLGRLLVGTTVKWLIVAGGLYLVIAVWQLPPVPALAATALTAAAFLFAGRNAATTMRTST